MSVMTQATEDVVRAALLEAVSAASGEIEVGALISTVAQQADQDVELVTKSMWDLVDDGALSYGVDARVRPASPSQGR
jgi:uncharacterized protein with von Willebrand factor type A (vWA) domain